MVRVENSLAKEGVRIRKMAIGSTKSYRSMNLLMT